MNRLRNKQTKNEIKQPHTYACGSMSLRDTRVILIPFACALSNDL